MATAFPSRAIDHRCLPPILQKFRKWFKNGLKAQKLLAQGIALGYYGRKPVAL